MFKTPPQVTLKLNPVFRFLWRSYFVRCQNFQNIRPENSRKAGKGNTYGVSVVRSELVCGIDGVGQHGRGAALRSQRRGGKGDENLHCRSVPQKPWHVNPKIETPNKTILDNFPPPVTKCFFLEKMFLFLYTQNQDPA